MSDKIGTPAEQFVREGNARNAILRMKTKVDEINDFITACRKDGYNVNIGVTTHIGNADLIQVAILLPDGVENIRG